MFYVYLLASKPFGTLYVGITSDLSKRVYQHKSKAVPGFTARYGVDRLVWFEMHETADSAIRRESRSRNGNASGSSI
jgi:putative endonuclease